MSPRPIRCGENAMNEKTDRIHLVPSSSIGLMSGTPDLCYVSEASIPDVSCESLWAEEGE